MRIPLIDLQAGFRPIREEVFRRFDAVLETMQLLNGPNVEAFEKEFAAYCGSRHGVAVSSGTDALCAALWALDIGPGDEVVAPSHTFFATIEAILLSGATAVLVDVEAGTLTMDFEAFRAAITPSTRAVIPVHVYGHPAEMGPITTLARARGIHVIEDAAQAHGALYQGKRCGSLGDASAFSFYCTKNLGAFGEAGMVTTDDDKVAEKVRLLRHHGQVSRYEHAKIGRNLRMDELQASVLRLRLPDLERRNQRRQEIAAQYAAALAGHDVQVPTEWSGCRSVHHVYAIRTSKRDALQDFLERAGIGTGVHYKVPGHLQAALRDYPHRVESMTVTESVRHEVLSIPMFPELTDAQIHYITDHIVRFLEQSTLHAAHA